MRWPSGSASPRLGVGDGQAAGRAGAGAAQALPRRPLTEAGRRLALEVIRHHRLLELYLVESLGVPWDRVHQEAEVLEHVLSEELEELIAAKLGDPTHDPHGDPIPTRELTIVEGRDRAWRRCSPARAAHSCASRTPIRRCCGIWPSAGSRPATSFEVVDRQPFGGPLFVRFGEGRHPLGGELARAMRVRVAAVDGAARRGRR